MSGFCVYSVASALFMFPALYTYYQRALNIYSFEHADGVGKASDLVIQPFIRFISMAIIPVVVCAWILYLLVSEGLGVWQSGGMGSGGMGIWVSGNLGVWRYDMGVR